MAFETLADKYNLKSREIYARFSNPEQLVEIKPASDLSRERIIDDNRSLPFRSTRRDITRISRLLVSENPGRLFLAKQILLQTGNTFAETRIYNPTSPLTNVVPFLHRPRQFKPPTEKRGALQTDTVNSFNQPPTTLRGLVGQVFRTVVRPVSAITASFLGPRKGYEDKFYLRPEELVQFGRFRVGPSLSYEMFRVPLYAQQPLDLRGQKKRPLSTSALVRGETTLTREFVAYAVAANAYLSQFNFGPRVSQSDLLRGTESKIPNTINEFSVIKKAARAFNPSNSDQPAPPAYAVSVPVGNGRRNLTFNDRLSEYVRNIERTQGSSTNGYFDGNGTTLDTVETIEGVNQSKKSGRTLLLDPLNGRTPVSGSASNRVDYSSIVTTLQERTGTTDKDIVKFIFRQVTETNGDRGQPVQFRAFISELRQNVKPEYTETKYVGRTERFVNYSGAKRSVTMNFNIVAFSASELDNMWLRINYLTGLAFPRGVFDNGFMIPPLFRITVGDIYVDQPCYIENLDFDFLDDKITFDVDREVSQVINVSLSLSLLEKRSKFINSPYYGITEKLQGTSTVDVPRQITPDGGVRRITSAPAFTITAPQFPVGDGGTIPTSSVRPPIPPGPISPFEGFGGGGGFSGGGSGGRFP